MFNSDPQAIITQFATVIFNKFSISAIVSQFLTRGLIQLLPNFQLQIPISFLLRCVLNFYP